MILLYGSSESRILNFENRNRFMANAYWSANSFLESGNQVGTNA